jgi:CRISPR-associated endonuclease/helicase Cas3
MPGAAVLLDAAFHALFAGRTPFRWQRRLFDEFTKGRVPRTCALPTGLGKTSVIPIWLIALAHSASANGGRPLLPRRLVYIVNRRTVVDQATDDAKRLLGCIYRSGQRDSLPWATDATVAQLGLSNEPCLADEHVPAVGALRKTLSALAGDDGAAPLAVSTLRGELADNREWKTNPARPAIIIGTIDMIGSKLLFSGYGDGRYGRTHHAGLIGQDTLVVHDEAHLSPAFSALLRSVEKEQQRGNEGRWVRVMELSATTHSAAEDGGVFGLSDEDDQDMVVSQRRTAKKLLTFCDVGKGEAAEAVAARALTYRDAAARILVYVRYPEDAKTVADALKHKKDGLGDGADDRVCLLTGTIRGYERDRMASKNPVFRDMLSKREWSPPVQTIYLVATSAGEVGVDFDADHLVCDLSTLDSMAQRFGRVNRLGGAGRSAEITVVCEKPNMGVDSRKQREPSRLDAAIAKTGEILRKLAENGGDVSPSAVSKLLEAPDALTAFSPPPTNLPATDILFDSWALTSITGNLPGRPEVGPYLHGVAEWEPPEIYVAWRADLVYLAEAEHSGSLDGDALEDILEKYPLKSWEQLRETLRWERTTRSWVSDKLTELAGEKRGQAGNKKPVGDMPAIVVDPDGTLVFTTIRQAAERNLSTGFRK